ncbi:MAG: hypothetical protein H0V07_13980 [Propionibacteriales bacterium]|nr:hypothetical protein [Propionibacteriales bacterium]
MTQRRFLPVGAVMALFVLLGGVDPAQAATVSNYAMRTWQINGTVEAIAFSGSTVYVGGRFTRVISPSGSQSKVRRNLAAFNVATGAPRRWNPRANGEVRAIAVSPNGATVYIGGDFTSVAGVGRAHVASVSARTGNARHFAPDIAASVRAIAISSDGSKLYLGGPFERADGARRLHLASYRVATGSLRRWAPNPHGSNTQNNRIRQPSTVAAMTLSPNDATLYVGGVFTTIRGKSRTNGAAISAGTGRVRAFRPSLSHVVLTVDVTSHGKRILFGGRGPGGFIGAYGTRRGTKLWYRHLDGDVQAATVRGRRIYVGGHFDKVAKSTGGSVTRHHLAVLSVSTGSVGAWNPTANSYPGVFGMASRRGHVAAGGSFTKINGNPQAGFAEFSG